MEGRAGSSFEVHQRPKGLDPSEVDLRVTLGRWVQEARERRAISQSELARQVGLTKAMVHYIEKGERSMSIGHIEHLAHALGLRLKDFLAWHESGCEDKIHRGAVKRVEFALDYQHQAFRIYSFLPRINSFFFGKLVLEPQKTAPPEEAPHGDLILYQVTRGRFLFRVHGKEILCSEGEHLLLEDHLSYEIFNPHPLNEAASFLITVPSFVR